MLLKLTVILFLGVYIGAHSADTDAAPLTEDSGESESLQADELSPEISNEEPEQPSVDLQPNVEDVTKEDNENSENSEESTDEKPENPEKDEGAQPAEETVTETEDEPKSEDDLSPEEAEEIVKEKQGEDALEEQVADDVKSSQPEEEALPENQENAEIDEEDRAQFCVAKEIDCHFYQPITFDGIEQSVLANKSPAEICGGLKAGDKCLEEILEGDCVPYLMRDEEKNREKRAPVIKYFCDDNIEAVENNWQCLKSSLTEANLNVCSDFDPSSTCDVTKFVECLTEQFDDKCTDQAQEIFIHFYTDLATLQLGDCANDFQESEAKTTGGFFDFF